MKLIFKYLKPFWLLAILIVGLTFLRVQSELALPDYMSDIVTNGIQYGGISENVPLVLTAEKMETLSLFLDEEAKTKLHDSYSQLPAGETVIVDKEEVKFKETAYILKENVDEKQLATTLQKSLVYNYLLNQNDLTVNQSNVTEIKNQLDNSLIGLEDNYASMAKLSIQSIYTNVGVDTASIQNRYILHVGLLMLGISLFSVAANILSTFTSTSISTKIGAKLRRDVFEKVQSFSSSEFSRFSTSSLITRSGNDITKIQMLVHMMLSMMLMSPIMGISAVFKVINYPSISWLLLIAIAVILATLIFLLLVAVPKFEIIQRLVDKLNSVMREFLDGILVIRAFNSEKSEEKRFDDVNKKQTSIDRFISRTMSIMGPIMTFTMNSLTIIITWFAAKQINMDVMTIGDMMAFVQYAIHVVMSFMMISVTFFMIPRSLVSAKRISEVLDVENSINDKTNAEELPLENGELVFDNVSFKYPGDGEYVLEDISFSVKPGETLALIGSTGSGKSTIVKLIPRLFDVTKGKITYCGKDLRDLKQKQLHDKIGFISQKAILFTGSIRSNVVFGREVSDEELNNAIEVSQSANIIKEKVDGLDEKITQGGTNVSGGQKQRLSIARALAKEANIYIFDDSFSALDYETDKKLRNELNKLIAKTKATVIIVAQRISTIKNADKILVLDNGKIVGSGKHEDLLNDCDVYKEIARSQLSEEELNNARA